MTSWFQSTYALVPDQGTRGGSICLLDNGQIWFLVRAVYDPPTGVWHADSVHIYVIESAGAAPIRVTGDIGQLGEKDDGPAPNPPFFMVEGPIYDTGIAGRDGNATMYTDGTTLYLHFEHDVDTWEWWTINPETMELADTGTTTLNRVLGAVVHDGFIYYMEEGTGQPGRIRKLNTTTFVHEPDIFNTVDESTDWEKRINATTGLANAFNDDYMEGIHAMTLEKSSDGDIYLWMLDESVVGVAIRRISIQGGSIETMYFALGNEHHELLADPNYPYGLGDRQDEHDPVDVPEGFAFGEGSDATGGIALTRFHHTATNPPRWRGFDPRLAPFVIFGDSSWLLVRNRANTGFVGGTGESPSDLLNDSMCVFDIPDLVARFQAGGPVRHDKGNPIYEVVSNSRHQETALSSGNGQIGLNNTGNGRYPNREMHWRDGPSRDALMVPTETFGGSSDHPNWNGKVYVQHVADRRFLTGAPGSNPRGTQVIAQIEPENLIDTAHEIRVRFSGTALKGYAPIHGGQKSVARSEIILQ